MTCAFGVDFVRSAKLSGRGLCDGWAGAFTKLEL